MYITKMAVKLGLPVCYYFYFSFHCFFCPFALRIVRTEFMCVQIVERRLERRSINSAVELFYCLFIISLCKYLISKTINLILQTTITQLILNNLNHQQDKLINIILINNSFLHNRLWADFNRNKQQEVHLAISH